MNEEDLKQLIRSAIKNVLAEQEGKAEKPQTATDHSGAESDAKQGSSPTGYSGAVANQKMKLIEEGIFKKGTNPKEVVIGISPNFYVNQKATIVGLPHEQVLKEITAGIEEEGLTYRLMRVQNTADVAFVAHAAAKGSGSGIGIGVIARGTTVIHQRDLAPLSNLELFPQCPLLDADTFRAIGKNAARYAKGESPDPVPVRNDQMARPKFQAIAALMHNKETQLVDLNARNIELRIDFG